MGKIHGKLMLLAAVLTSGIASGDSGTPPSQEEMWRIIQQQQAEIAALQQELATTRGEVKATAQQVATSGGGDGGGGGDWDQWFKRVTLSGLIEVEAGAVDDVDYTDSDASDIVLSTVEIGIDATINEWVQGHILLLYEDDGDTPLDVDEATITIGNSAVSPGFITAGQTYVPFGNFPTNLISDPLTLELAETRETILQVGMESSGWHGSAYVFNGLAQERGTNDHIDQYGMNLGYAGEHNGVSLDLGASFISSLDDSDTIEGYLDDAGMLEELDDHVPGIGLYGIVGYQGVSLAGEYITATDNFTATEMPWKTGGAQPRAWQSELGYTFDLMGKETTVAISYQGTREAVALGLPRQRILGGISVGILDHTSLAFEVGQDDDYRSGQGGTGNESNQATMQLAVEF